MVASEVGFQVIIGGREGEVYGWLDRKRPVCVAEER